VCHKARQKNVDTFPAECLMCGVCVSQSLPETVDTFPAKLRRIEKIEKNCEEL
jgi:hypothetical protein